MNFSQHGGNLRDYEETYGRDTLVTDFSAALNPLGPPESLKPVFAEASHLLSYFPDPKAREVRSEIARHYPVFPENVAVAQSIPDLFLSVLRTLKPKRVLLVEPCSTDYRRLLNLEGIETLSFLLNESDGFEAGEQKILNAVQNVDLFVISNPNGATGSAHNRESLKAIIQEAHRRDVFAVLDEYYSDWAMQYSFAREVQDSAYFFVMKSFASFYALPGLRLAYGLGARKLIERIQTRACSPCCDRLSEKLAIQALRDGIYREETRDWFEPELKRVIDELYQYKGLKVYPTVTPNILLKFRGSLDTKSLTELFASKGHLLRACSDFAGLDQSYLRMSIKSRKENDAFLNGLRDWLAASASDLTVSL